MLVALHPRRRLRLRYGPAGLALGWYGAAPLGREHAAHENLPMAPLPGVYGAAALGRKSAALREGEVGSRAVSRRARGGGPFPV